MCSSDYSCDTIGLLSKSERKERVSKYLRKKKMRNNKKREVKYQCRKELANQRYRFQGRFIKLEDLPEMQDKYIIDERNKKIIKPIFHTEKVDRDPI